MSIYLVLLVVLALSGVAMTALTLAAKTQLMIRHRTRTDLAQGVKPREHQLSVVINSVVSTGLVFGLSWLLHDYLYYSEEIPSAGRLAFEALAILALYDFGYYLLHRFAFHQWSPGRRIHAVHHRIRTPFAGDSLFIHPVETALGVGLLMTCTLIVGPVSVYSFGLCFFIYSFLNVLIHAAFNLPFFPFRAMSAMSAHHDIHHASMQGGYYASITPLWDVVFGTATLRVARQRRPGPGEAA